MSSRIRVAICGGGIGGLCLAVSLSQYPNITVELYEAASQFREIGAGVMIWSRTWHILELMGLADEFSKIAHAQSPPTGPGFTAVGFDFRRSDQPHEGVRFKLVEMPYGCIRFHRASFLDVFINHLPHDIAHFGKRLTSYSQKSPLGPISLSFADGTTAVCDVLIGADGIKSCIRAQMYRETAANANDPRFLRYIHPTWTGTMAYRGLVRVQDIPLSKDGSPHRTIQTPTMYCGKKKHVVSYSISQGDIVNVVTFVSHPENHEAPYEKEWVVDCEQKELLDCYSGWEPEVEALLKCIHKPSRWAIHHLSPLPFYRQGRVVLMGDAAHAMSPHQGAGAGQAIEDAFFLAQLLSKATLESLDSSLSAYQTVRLPAANRILSESYESGMMYEFISTFGNDYEKLGPAIERQWSWVEETTVEDDLGHAMQLASKL